MKVYIVANIEIISGKKSQGNWPLAEKKKKTKRNKQQEKAEEKEVEK